MLEIDGKPFRGLGKGTYALVFKLGEERIKIGTLGAFEFREGFYIYVGSALGSGGLAGRLRHHRERTQRPHWHIDYLRNRAQLKQIWCVPGEERREHQWWHLLQGFEEARVPVKGFGASDCSCEAHLIYTVNVPHAEKFRRLLRVAFPEDSPLIVFRL